MVKMLVTLTTKGFIEEVASSSPAPGGGSVAALAGAQGFALIAMVARLTLGREKFAAVEPDMKEMLDAAEGKQKRLLELVEEDTEGFKLVMAALALPKETDAEKAFRRGELERATLKAAEIPLETAELCWEGLRRISELLAKGNPNALSDMGVAALSLKTGLDGALYNVQMNALGLKTIEKKEELLKVCKGMREEGSQLAVAAQQEILARLS
jgi:formiminotetrahydrofolate cyclodeaminase